MEILSLDKKESYSVFMAKVKEAYSAENREWVYCLSDVEHRTNQMVFLCADWRNIAFNFTHGLYLNHNDYGYMNNGFTELSRYLACRSEAEMYQKIFTTHYQYDSLFYKCMVESFYGLALAHKEVRRSFMRAYMLWQHAVEVGCAGYSKRLKRQLPYYLTYFGKSAFIVDPITGSINRLDIGRRCPQGFLVEEDRQAVWIYLQTTKPDVLLCKWVKSEKSLHNHVKKYDACHDLKVAEREKRREAGHKVKDTKWLTVNLGTLDESSYNIRAHSLICLLVFGLEATMLTLMNSNAIMSVDHINAQHSDNRIDNLQIISNCDNKVKKGHTHCDKFIFDFGAFFLGLPQHKVQPNIEEEKEDSDSVAAFNNYWDRLLSPWEVAALCGGHIVMKD